MRLLDAFDGKPLQVWWRDEKRLEFNMHLLVGIMISFWLPLVIWRYWKIARFYLLPRGIYIREFTKRMAIVVLITSPPPITCTIMQYLVSCAAPGWRFSCPCRRTFLPPLCKNHCHVLMLVRLYSKFLADLRRSHEQPWRPHRGLLLSRLQVRHIRLVGWSRTCLERWHRLQGTYR